MEIVGDAYGGTGKRRLHFQDARAKEAIMSVVTASVECLRERRAAKVLSAHCAARLPWNQVGPYLKPAPMKLVQTHVEDHKQARENKDLFAAQWTREFVNDIAAEVDIRSLGGEALQERHRTFQRGSHRADLWRYIRLCQEGGYYLDIKMCLLQPLKDTLDCIYRQGNALVQMAKMQGEEQDSNPLHQCQRIAQPGWAEGVLRVVQGDDLQRQAHLVMSRGADKSHVYQGNILACSPGHPLMVRAIHDAIGTTNSQLNKQYLRFCQFLWRELTNDLGSEPQIGWNFCPTLGPVYLFDERFVKNGKRRVKSVQVNDVEVEVDGHFMFLEGEEVRYAATRAWGWSHGFLQAALTAEVMGQNIAQPASSSTLAASSSSTSGDVAQSIAQPGPAASEGDTDMVTSEVLDRCIAAAAASPHYAGLVESEIATLFGMGLSVIDDGWLCCRICRNRSRKPKKFQGTNEVRGHFRTGHEEVAAATTTSQAKDWSQYCNETFSRCKMDADVPAAADDVLEEEPLEPARAGVWVAADVQSRTAAAAAVVRSVSPGDILALEVQRSTGAVSTLFVNLARMWTMAEAANKLGFRVAVLRLMPFPDCLQNIVQQKKGNSFWEDVGTVQSLRDNVHPGGPTEANLVRVRQQNGSYKVVKITVYAAIVSHMIFQECAALLSGLNAPAKGLAWRCICVHFNARAESEGHLTRLLLGSEKASREWKLDYDPGNPENHYCGARKRLTTTQESEQRLRGRARRVDTQL
eukprot:Skav223147  [mRNA]  locus=scaffold6891:10010:12865:- [translate_table: standard]